MDLVADSRWEPQTVREEAVVDTGRVAALSALFDDGNPARVPGDELPPLWHWVALPQWCPSSMLSFDGHPRRGSFLPPIDLPRRMFAGGEIEFHAALTVGGSIRRESWVDGVEEKTGRSGSLVIVRVTTHLYNDQSEPAVVERQNLIFREAASGTSSGADPDGAAMQRPTSAATPHPQVGLGFRDGSVAADAIQRRNRERPPDSLRPNLRAWRGQ